MLVSRLVELTDAGKLEWAIDRAMRNRRNDVDGHVYKCIYKKHNIALYEYKYRHYYDEDEYTDATSVALELIETDGTLLLSIAQQGLQEDLRDLLQTVRRKTSRASELLTALLSEDD